MRIIRIPDYDLPELSYNPWDDDEGDNDDDEYLEALAPEPDPEAAARRLREIELQFTADSMSRTEVVLRFAIYLLTRHHAAGDITVSLPGEDLRRSHIPKFPVIEFLRVRGIVPRAETNDWRATYYMKCLPHGLAVSAERTGADIVAPLAVGRRLVGFATCGSLKGSRGSGEHKLVRGTIGRAMTWPHYTCDDVLIAITPRSDRFRRLADECRTAPLIANANILIATVTRAGDVKGFPAD